MAGPSELVEVELTGLLGGVGLVVGLDRDLARAVLPLGGRHRQRHGVRLLAVSALAREPVH